LDYVELLLPSQLPKIGMHCHCCYDYVRGTRIKYEGSLWLFVDILTYEAI
jgi:hypothetical protein